MAHDGGTPSPARVSMLAWRDYSPAATPRGVYGAAGAPSPITFTFKLERVDGTPAVYDRS